MHRRLIALLAAGVTATAASAALAQDFGASIVIGPQGVVGASLVTGHSQTYAPAYGHPPTYGHPRTVHACYGVTNSEEEQVFWGSRHRQAIHVAA